MSQQKMTEMSQWKKTRPTPKGPSVCPAAQHTFELV